MGKRKGSLKETLSSALHKDDPIFYKIKTESLEDFIAKEEFSDIPLTRILQITRNGEVVWEKGQQQIKGKNR